MKRFLLLNLLVASLLSMSACAGMTDIASGAGKLAGVEMPETEEVELNVGQLCSACSATTHSAINPFTEPVKYTKINDAEVDGFVQSANEAYGTVMVVEKLVGVSKTLADGGKVEGFKDADEVLTLAKGLFASASTDIPNLLTTGTGLVSSAPTKFVGPKAMVLPTAAEQLQLAVERLNEASGKLVDLGGSFTDEAAAPEAAPAAE